MLMPAKLVKAIIKTLVYADIFDYPLVLDEIKRWLIESSLPAGKAGITNQELRINNFKNIKEKDGYYFLKSRGKLVALRKEREKYSQEKLKLAQEITNLLKLIPIIKLIGITGALAVDNAKEDDDIDLFIITSAGLLWSTRLLSTLLIEITGMRRHPQETSVNNKICLNMFVDEEHLSVTRKERDLFSAHEVVQMRPIWERDDTYNKFLRANEWVREYLPNAIRIMNYESGIRNNKKIPILPFYFLEKLLKHFQLWFMKSRRTTEVISDGVIRFHPQDARVWVMRRYKQIVSSYFLL